MPRWRTSPAQPGKAHRWLLESLFAWPWLLAPGLVLLLLLGWFAASHVGSGFMPKMDESGFVLDFRSAPGTSLPETSRELAQVEAILHATPDVATFSTRIGAGLNGGLSEPNRGDFFVRLKTGPRRPIETIMAEAQDQIDAAVPGSKADGSQVLDLQRDALLGAGIPADRLYEDHASGKRDGRPGLDACLKALRKNDTLVAWKLDRLGRDLRYLGGTP